MNLKVFQNLLALLMSVFFIFLIHFATFTRRRDTQNLQKHRKNPFVVDKKHPEKQNVFNSSKVSPGMKTYPGAV